jgi:hypothetical protein
VDSLLSRLLHELICSVTATVNGIELIEEFGQKFNDSITGNFVIPCIKALGIASITSAIFA